MSHDDIRAALEAASPQPWKPIYLEGTDPHDVPIEDATGDYICASPDDGVRGGHSAADAHLIANAPTWLAELLAENERLAVDAERAREQYGYAVDRVQHHQERAEKAEFELDQLRLSDDYKPEGVDIVMAKLRDYERRAEAAEQTIQRVRWQCDSWSHGNSWNKAARNAILRALDGGEQ